MHVRPPAIVNLMEDAVAPKSTFLFKDLQRLRTRVGDMLSGKIRNAAEHDERAIQAIYGGLSRDLDKHVIDALTHSHGEAGASALWHGINERFAEEIAQKRVALGKLVGIRQGEQVTGTAVVDKIETMASGGKGADPRRLEQIKQVMGPDTWNAIAGAIVRDMGRDKNGLTSVAKFRTEYANMSEEGKALLFSPEHKAALDKISLVGQKYEQLQSWGNPSGTTRGVLTGGMFMGLFTHPYAVVGTAVGNYMLAKLLAHPAGSTAIADFIEKYTTMAEQYAAGKIGTSPEAVNQALHEATRAYRAVIELAAIPVQTPQQAANLAPGTPVRTPDGDVRHVK